jgi:serine/threonine protein kinase
MTQVLNELGRGTFGVVYLVRHMANDMLYTIKLYFDMRSKQAIRESYFLELMRENPVVVRLKRMSYWRPECSLNAP